MDQSLNAKKPTIEQQIDFVRGARHLVSKENRSVTFHTDNHAMLMAIEENLLAVKQWNETFARKLDEGSIVTILHFEDNHQDFLQWHLDSNGVVVKSEPLQTSVWKGTKVLDFKDLKPGSVVVIQNDQIGITTLNYRINRVEEVRNGQ